MKTIMQSLVILTTCLKITCQAFVPISPPPPPLQMPSTDSRRHYRRPEIRIISSKTTITNGIKKFNPTGSFKNNMMSTVIGETKAPSNVFTAIQHTISLLSKSSLGISSTSASSTASASVALESITDALSTTPPLVYFLCLIAAGFGVPVSEDAMCIFAGTILPTIWTVDPTKRNRLLLALYGGVVMSDIITFCIGRALKMGILEPIRKRINLQTERIEFCNDNDIDIDTMVKNKDATTNDDNIDGDENEDDTICQVETPKLRKRDRVLTKLENAGDYAGFVIRFSVGFRAPMMLFAGFSGKVPLSKYVIGTCIGAMGSLSLQLLIGYIMRYNPAAVVGIIASISTFVALVPLSIGLISSISLMWQKYRIRRNIQ